MNLLQNPGFENGTHHQDGIPEVVVPNGWIAFWYEGSATHDPQNNVGYCRPEFKLSTLAEDPKRIHTGTQSAHFFGFGKIVRAGYYQTVQATPFQRYEFSVWAHAWSNDGFNKSNKHKDDSRWSEGERVGFNAFAMNAAYPMDSSEANITFRIGIDPTGGTDYTSEAIDWCEGVCVYNAFHRLAIECNAIHTAATVFLLAEALWPFKHNDVYFDDAALVEVSEPVAMWVRLADIRNTDLVSVLR